MYSIIVIVVIATLLLIGIVVYFIFSRMRKEAWEGELIEKREESTTAGEYEQTNYMLYVQTTEGTRKRVAVRNKLYKQLNVGDKLIKIKGESYPKKVTV